MEFDVVIIGAGAAGLIAARDLARAGRSVALLEARDRLGGRLRSVADPRALAPIELGGEFVHGRPAVTYALLREYGATVVDNADAGFFLRACGLEAVDEDPFARVGRLLARALTRDADESVQALIEREANGAAAHDTDVWTRRLVGGFDAADPARASARALAQEWGGDASADGAQARPLGGYAPLIAHLARSLDPALVTLRQNTCVTRIARDARGVAVEARAGSRRLTVRARHALVTVPHGVLLADAGSAGAIAFEPPLPPATHDAIARIAMGPVVKVVLRFRSAFWETLADGAWRDGAFYNGDAPFPTLWTQLPLRANTLVAWAGGPAAERFAERSDDERIADALASAALFFGDDAAVTDAFECAYTHDWQRDPFARGAYSYALVGGERARDLLAVPVDGMLWFAGEATATDGETGTVAGALQSGQRAARAIAAARAQLYA